MNFTNAGKIKTRLKVDNYYNTNISHKIDTNYTNASYQMASSATSSDLGFEELSQSPKPRLLSVH